VKNISIYKTCYNYNRYSNKDLLQPVTTYRQNLKERLFARIVFYMIYIYIYIFCFVLGNNIKLHQLPIYFGVQHRFSRNKSINLT
jgi:hypothetical protein